MWLVCCDFLFVILCPKTEAGSLDLPRYCSTWRWRTTDPLCLDVHTLCTCSHGATIVGSSCAGRRSDKCVQTVVLCHTTTLISVINLKGNCVWVTWFDFLGSDSFVPIRRSSRHILKTRKKTSLFCNIKVNLDEAFWRRLEKSVSQWETWEILRSCSLVLGSLMFVWTTWTWVKSQTSVCHQEKHNDFF